MRVVSLVPSWTETLIEAGVDIVGRTRFCIHPKDRVSSIPAVGGTKDWKLDRLLELKPDLLVLDREENPKFMSEESGLPFVATHVASVDDVSSSLRELASATSSKKLSEMAIDWSEVLSMPKLSLWTPDREVPGLIEWGRPPAGPITKVIYLIWKDPWMAVSRDTFIGSVLDRCGFDGLVATTPQKYPVVRLEDEVDRDSTLLLLSSEPYPFLKKRQGLDELGFPYAFVDGEKFSWFGARSLEFLKSLRG